MNKKYIFRRLTKDGNFIINFKDAEAALKSGISLEEYLQKYYPQIQYTLIRDHELQYGLGDKGTLIQTFSGIIDIEDCLFEFSDLIDSCKLYAKVHLWKDAIFDLCTTYPKISNIFLLVNYIFNGKEYWEKIILIVSESDA